MYVLNNCLYAGTYENNILIYNLPNLTKLKTISNNWGRVTCIIKDPLE